MDLMNIFRFDDQGRLVEGYVRTDYRSFLRQLGAAGTDPRWTDEIAQPHANVAKRPHYAADR